MRPGGATSCTTCPAGSVASLDRFGPLSSRNALLVLNILLDIYAGASIAGLRAKPVRLARYLTEQPAKTVPPTRSRWGRALPSVFRAALEPPPTVCPVSVFDGEKRLHILKSIRLWVVSPSLDSDRYTGASGQKTCKDNGCSFSANLNPSWPVTFNISAIATPTNMYTVYTGNDMRSAYYFSMCTKASNSSCRSSVRPSRRPLFALYVRAPAHRGLPIPRMARLSTPSLAARPGLVRSSIGEGNAP